MRQMYSWDKKDTKSWKSSQFLNKILKSNISNTSNYQSSIWLHTVYPRNSHSLASPYGIHQTAHKTRITRVSLYQPSRAGSYCIAFQPRPNPFLFLRTESSLFRCLLVNSFPWEGEKGRHTLLSRAKGPRVQMASDRLAGTNEQIIHNLWFPRRPRRSCT